MDYLAIFKVLGNASVAFIIYLITKEIITGIKTKNGYPDLQNNTQRIKVLEKTVTNEYRHEIDNIWAELRGLRKDTNSYRDRLEDQMNHLENRVIKIETYYDKNK